MSGWAAFGFGVLFGAVLFDQLWRHVRRLEKRLASLRGEIGYYTQADIDGALGRVRRFSFEPSAAEIAAAALPTPEVPGESEEEMK